jgi:iron(III) transport system substrate-binding protein
MRKTIISLVTVAMSLAAVASHADGEVNLYSYRQPFLIEPMLEEFTNQTGTKVNVVFAKKGMVEKIKAAGDNNPADAVLTVDIGRLDALHKAGLLEPVDSAVLNETIPAHLRHPDGMWFGLTTRARLALTSKDRVKPGELETIADLADPKFRGRICTRSGKHVYNVALIASVIAHEGEEAAQRWLTGVRDNLARKPQGNDRAQAKGIYEGVCDVAISNHYYMGKMATNEKKPEQKDWARAIRVQFLDQDGPGQHVNISGAAVIKGAKNRDDAIRLIEFLSGDIAQQMYASSNFEYPVKAGVATDPLIEALGEFRADPIPLSEIARHRKAASQIVDRVGFEEGPDA